MLTMHRTLRCISLIFLLSLTTGSILYTESLKEFKYDVQLTLDVPPTATKDDHATMSVFSKYGQRFVCHLPMVHHDNMTNVTPPISDSVIASMMAKFNSTVCLHWRREWWTYELCYQRYVLQYHEGETGRNSEILLGQFDHDASWNYTDNPEKPLFHKQLYINGSICDLTFKRRRVEVRFFCSEKGPSRIFRVEELSTCVYQMDVATPVLCSHPSFVTRVSPKVEHIVCAPHVDDNENIKHVPDIVESESIVPNRLSLSAKLRPLNMSEIFSKMQRRRWNVTRRIVKRLMRKFMQILTGPVSQTFQAGLPNAFVLHVEHMRRNAFHPSKMSSFRMALERSDLDQSAVTLQKGIEQFQIYLERVTMHYIRHPQLLSAFVVVHSLTKLVHSLVEAKLSFFTNLAEEAINFPHDKLTALINILIEIGTELLRRLDNNTVNRVKEDLDDLYDKYGTTAEAEPTDLVGTRSDEKSPVRIRPHKTARQSVLWTYTPDEAFIMYRVAAVLGRQLLILKPLQDAVDSIAKMKDAEAEFGSTIQNLLSDMKVRVVVVRSLNAADKHKGNTEEADVENADPTVSRSMWSVMERALQKLSPEVSYNWEFYETENSKGFATVFIMSNEEKLKELRRMEKLRSVYQFKTSNTDVENKS